jgi:hypothetical protein
MKLVYKCNAINKIYLSLKCNRHIFLISLQNQAFTFNEFYGLTSNLHYTHFYFNLESRDINMD